MRDTTTNNVTLTNNLANTQIAQIGGPSVTLSHNVTNATSSWFTAVSLGNLHLTALATGAIDQGVAVAGLTDDFDGQPRTGAIDIGADQQFMLLPPPRLEIK